MVGALYLYVCGILPFCLQLDINTVAAGGGSVLTFRAGLFVVGPESAGASPGPACYSKGNAACIIILLCTSIIINTSARYNLLYAGGPPTVTDANLCLGRLMPKYVHVHDIVHLYCGSL